MCVQVNPCRHVDMSASLLSLRHAPNRALWIDASRRGGGLGSSTIFKKFHETYAPSYSLNGTRPHPPISPRTFFCFSTPAPHLSPVFELRGYVWRTSVPSQWKYSCAYTYVNLFLAHKSLFQDSVCFFSRTLYKYIRMCTLTHLAYLRLIRVALHVRTSLVLTGLFSRTLQNKFIGRCLLTQLAYRIVSLYAFKGLSV